jgi:uncharacterized protein
MQNRGIGSLLSAGNTVRRVGGGNPEHVLALSLSGMRLPRRVRRFAAFWGISAVVLYGVSAMIDVRGLLESRLFYYPSREHFMKAPTAEEVYFLSEDGLKLHGWFFKSAEAAAGRPSPAIVHVHGNAGNINWHTEFSSFLPGEGVSVLMFDYRGYGKSELPRRRLCRDDLVTDTRAALAYIRSRPDVAPGQVGVYGVSIGAVIGLAAAAEDPRVAAVASISAFSTWRGVATDHAGRIAARLVPTGCEASEAVAALGTRPLLIVHGEKDEIVSVAHAHRLKAAADAAGVATEVMIDPAADHNSILYTNAELRQQVAAWLRSHLQGGGRAE